MGLIVVVAVVALFPFLIVAPLSAVLHLQGACGFAEESEAAALMKARGAKRKAAAPTDAETLEQLAELDVEVSPSCTVEDHEACKPGVCRQHSSTRRRVSWVNPSSSPRHPACLPAAGQGAVRQALHPHSPRPQEVAQGAWAYGRRCQGGAHRPHRGQAEQRLSRTGWLLRGRVRS